MKSNPPPLPQNSLPADHAAAVWMIAEGAARLRRLALVRGASRRTRTKRRQAAVLALLGATMLGGSADAGDAPANRWRTPFPASLVPPAIRNSAVAVDIDGDGDLDVFIGDADGNTTFFHNIGSPSSPELASTSTSNPFGLADVGYNARPAFADVDGDGDLDAFIGQTGGDVLFFQNTGTPGSPAFAGPSTNPFGLASVGTGSHPTFADVDGDGDLDAFVGSGSGNTFFFANTGSVNSPAFAAAQSNPFGLADVGGYSAPRFVDIDDDGDLDAFLGAFDGDVDFFPNTGTANAPAFAPSSANPFGLPGVTGYASVDLVDLDGDGDFDAIHGSSTADVAVFQNTGSASTPTFGPWPPNPFDLPDVGFHSWPTLADIDADGDLDLFVGDLSDGVAFFRNLGSAGSPRFGASTLNPFGLVNVAGNRPELADIDADGDLDAFVGSSSGNTIYFPNTGNATTPAFGASTSNPFGLADVGGYSSPRLVDLDDDGDLDAFVGGFDGNVHYFQNTGTAASPAFATSTVNPFGLSDVGNYSSPTFADLDGDGDLDLLLGNGAGELRRIGNVGSPGAPAFSGAALPGSMIDVVENNAAPALADLDADGDFDAIVGGGPNGSLFYFRNDKNTGVDTVGLHDPANAAFFLRDQHANGPADHTFLFGPPGQGWFPVAGDWDENPTSTAGLYDGGNGAFFLRNSHSNGAADLTFFFGPPGMGWQPITGDWDGDGDVTVGLYDPTNGAFFLRNVHSNGPADETFFFGPPGAGWKPIAGDWDNDGDDNVGLYDPVNGVFFLRNLHANGPANHTFFFGPANAGWLPIAGDWNGFGADRVGLYDPVNGAFFLRNAHSNGPADQTFFFGPPNAGWIPIAGDWNAQ